MRGFETYLALVVHDAGMAPLGGLVEIRILKHDTRALATALKRDVLEVVGRGLHDSPASVGAARKGDLVYAHMPGESLAGDGADAGDDVDDTRWEAGLDDKLAEVESRQWGLLSGLEDDCVSAGEGWRDFPGEHHEGEVPVVMSEHRSSSADLTRPQRSNRRDVPGNNLTADSERLLQHVCQLGWRRLNRAAGDLVSSTGVVPEDVVGLVEITVESVGICLENTRNHHQHCTTLI